MDKYHNLQYNLSNMSDKIQYRLCILIITSKSNFIKTVPVLMN